MEPHPGVFLSNVKTEEWEPDLEVPGSEMHELVHTGGVWAGLTRFTTVDGPSPIPVHELVHLRSRNIRVVDPVMR